MSVTVICKGDMRGDFDLSTVLGLVVIPFDLALVERIRHLMKLTDEDAVYEAKEWNYQAEWKQWACDDDEVMEILGEEEFRTECDFLVVGRDFFYWEAYAKHTNVIVSTSHLGPVLLDEIEAALKEGRDLEIDITKREEEIGE